MIPYQYHNCTYFDHDGAAVNASAYRTALQHFRDTMEHDYLDERAYLVDDEDQVCGAPGTRGGGQRVVQRDSKGTPRPEVGTARGQGVYRGGRPAFGGAWEGP